MKTTVTPERESEIRAAHEAYRANEDLQVKDGFRAVEDLLTLLDTERDAVETRLVLWESRPQTIITRGAAARAIRAAKKGAVL